MDKFADLQGKTIRHIDVTEDEVKFILADGTRWRLYHSQDCCESVFIESIVGDTADLLNTPILLAEEATSEKDPEGFKASESDYRFGRDSQTWTLYKLRTIKGSVDIRFYGSSNGFYSEAVDFAEDTSL